MDNTLLNYNFGWQHNNSKNMNWYKMKYGVSLPNGQTFLWPLKLLFKKTFFLLFISLLICSEFKMWQF